MKKLCTRTLAILGLAGPLLLTGAHAEEPKAKTIAELAARYDSSSCVACHAKEYNEWHKSLHARSIFGQLAVGHTAATFISTIENGLKEAAHSGVSTPEDVGVRHLMACAKCHLPQLQDAEDSVAREIVHNLSIVAESPYNEEARAALTSLNINCVVCHNRNAITHQWTDGPPAAQTVYGSKTGPHEDTAYPAMKESKVMGESLFCGQCHGLGPSLEQGNTIQCATLYGSHLFAYIPEGGTETCQQCHMHKSGLGHNMQAYRSPEMVKMALDVEVETNAFEWRDGSIMTPVAHVLVEMTNKAGHAIPDGLPAQNRVMLYVTAKTLDGKVFYRNEKMYMPIPQQLGRGQIMGRGPFEQSGMIHNSALPPRKMTKESFMIPVYTESEEDGKVSRPLLAQDFTVDVEIWYLPYGKKDDPGNAQKWFSLSKNLHLPAEED